MKQEDGSMLEVKQHVKRMMKQGDKTKDKTYSETFIETCKREKMKSVQTLHVISVVRRKS
jgi:general stress protein 26